MPISNLAEQNNLGYVLHPPRRASEPGYARLDAVIAPRPSGHHFDPCFLRLWVAAEHGEQAEHLGVSCQTIEHPWNGENRLRVCAGQADLIARADDGRPSGKHLDAFTFGGELWVETADEHTCVVLLSPAPILLMYGLQVASRNALAATLLAQESEILLAQRRAFWEQAPEEFERRLATVEPLTLYLACLQAIQERFTHLPPASDDVAQHLQRILRLEIQALEKQTSHLTGAGGFLLERIL